MQLTTSEDNIEDLDIDDHGMTFFDLIDNENHRYRQQLMVLEQKLQQAHIQHVEIMIAIKKGFGIETEHPKKITLTRQMKRQIKKRVKQWSKIDKQSGCE